VTTLGPRTPASRRPRLPGGPPALTPKLAVRIAALGTVLLIALGILVLRLWFLQVISGSDYQAQANANRLRVVVADAPRGVVEDRYGQVLVNNKPGQDVVVRPQDVRGPRGQAMLTRLAVVVGKSPQELMAKVAGGLRTAPYESVVLASNVSPEVQSYLLQRHLDYPGVSLRQVWLRRYPRGTLASQVLGYTGAIPPSQVNRYKRLGVPPDERVGVAGLEQTYQRYLRGTPGQEKVEVDATGQPVGRGVISVTPPRPGRTLQLSIDMRTQMALEKALRQKYENTGHPGAGVALDPQTGEVLAIASYPTFDPRAFEQGKVATIRSYARNKQTPLLDRAIQGLYPAGSTFKPFTAVAALMTRDPTTGQPLLTPWETIDSPYSITFKGQEFHGPKGTVGFGSINLETALEASSDTYFFQVGERFYALPNSPHQAWAERFGFGRATGIDLSGEYAGLVPTPEWRRRTFVGPRFGVIDRIWKPGYSLFLAIGQGDLQITPLQLAVAYSAIANGGTVVTPTLGRAVLSPDGTRQVDLLAGRRTRALGASPEALQAVRQGLYLAANGPDGTATSVFGSLPQRAKAAGKTGTAENPHGDDHSWWAGYAPYDNPRIAVSVIIENGGHGVDAAAPVACRTISAYLRVRGRCGQGVGQVAN
jgi:penicillin-binding protein 2